MAEPDTSICPEIGAPRASYRALRGRSSHRPAHFVSIGYQVLLGLAFLSFVGQSLSACPFCAAVSQTLDEEIRSMDVAVLADLEFAADWENEEVGVDGSTLPLSRFRVREILKGKDVAGDAAAEGAEIEVAYFGPDDKEPTFLLLSADPPQLIWGSPMALSDRAVEYVRNVIALPEKGDRLGFFLKHLEDADPLIGADAYDEFAKASFDKVIAIKDRLDRTQLLNWIKDPQVQVEHRRLYFTMLGLCGTPEDAKELEKLLTSEDPEQRMGLNALIAAYLSLKGAEGLPLINRLFLENDDAEYSDVHAAIMALRFHGTEVDIVPKEDVLRSMHLVLKRADMADLVIPDLARWEDWSVLPQLEKLYREADAESNWVRVPVVNYVKACPLPEAKPMLERLTKIDPDAVKRATALFAFASAGAVPPAGDPPAAKPEDTQSVAATELPDKAPDPFENQAQPLPNNRALWTDRVPAENWSYPPATRPGERPWWYWGFAVSALLALSSILLFLRRRSVVHS